MANPASREQLKEYSLRRLGSPVIDINVDDAQMEDRLDDALQFFAEYHFDGVERLYYKYQVTQSDIDANKTDLNAGYISLDNIDTNIVSVVRLFQFSESSVNLFDVRYQMALNDFYGIRTGMGNLANYDITKRHLSMIQQFLDPEKMIRFSRVKNRLYVDMNWDEDISADDYLVFECYAKIDPEVYTEIYDDILLKKYYTASIKRQWGSNLSKFEGIQLPGGVQFNGTQLFEQAQSELEKIEEEVQLRYELPIDFNVG